MQSTDSDYLEKRLAIIEAKLAIYQLIASHPPSADTGHAQYTRSVYHEEGVFDRGSGLDGAMGAQEIASFILRPEHEAAIQDGLAHFAGLPLIDLRGDEAVVTSYLMIVHLDHEGTLRTLPNHGSSNGYRIHRTLINRWDLRCFEGQWKILRRTLLPVDGSEEQRRLLQSGLNDLYGFM
ncbi:MULTISPECIES: nuclear transport factor 2 family protein [unclassified Pseudomonas]|uniref:nuclear transport factor 2 family protein n=1 Tax=unclassified Pseudomonas TaxID=196821 RepID=UPI000D3D73D0|nr:MULTISPECIES: nuclear transport factor 2 family protein [unclassified Pseudomonas]RAU47988.1 nuclear transport factor 2 family protein [Pseudomonas sp. RIT 409]RAU55318.1 nuclear transport factor 2 family protein [Pseudomonas sp. RIT 412]